VSGGYAGQTGIAAGGGVEVEIGGGVSEDGGADEVADAAGGTWISAVRWERGVKLPTEI
jgi:hypothetical protein